MDNMAIVQDLPTDDAPESLHRILGDRMRSAYRSALASLSGKRKAGTARRPEDGALDFADAPSATIVTAGPGAQGPVDLSGLSRLTAQLSGLAAATIPQGEGEARGRQLIVRRRLLTSEGTWVDERRSFVELVVSAGAHSTDGTALRSQIVFTAPEVGRLPPPAELERAVREMAAEVPAMRDAAPVNAAKAVVLFEAPAAASLLRHMAATELSGTPPPILALGRRPYQRKIPLLAAMLGKSVAPAFLELADDPRPEQGPGKSPLFGHYAADEEGVAPARVSILERGKLVSLPSSRVLRAGISRPNGHGRGSPHEGNYDGMPGTLWLSSKTGLAPAALRERAVAAARAQGPDTPVYIVRRAEFDRGTDETDGPINFVEGYGWGGSHLVATGRMVARLEPLVVSRLRDGREEPVRGLSLRGEIPGARLADIIAVGKEPTVLNYLEDPWVYGEGELPIPSSIVTPALVLANVEVGRPGQRDPRTLYPPPAPAGGAPTCHALPITGQPVRERLVAKALPAPQGGALRDGIYDGTADDYYVGPGKKEGPTDNLRRRTIRIQGNQIEFVVDQLEPEGVLLRTRGSFSTSGSVLTIATECPRTVTDRISYSVLGDTLHFYDSVGGQNIDVYVRRR
jgi:hypothetical protein